jgi:hypothetical protein
MNFLFILLISLFLLVFHLNEANQTCAKYGYAQIEDTVSHHCCSKIVIIDSHINPHGYLQINYTNPSYFNPLLNCVYHFHGESYERVQLFIEYFNLIDTSRPLSYPRIE